MAIISGTFYLVLLAFGVRQSRSAWIALAFVFVYVVIAGAGFPVRRAGAMAVISYIAILSNRERSTLNTFCLTLFLFLLLDPQAIFSLSFQLSFLSVFSMIVILRSFREGWKTSEIVIRTLAVMAGTFPLILFHFNVFSFVNIFANLLAIPLFHGALMMAFLTLIFEMVPWLGTGFAWMTHIFLKAALTWIYLLASVKWSYLFLQTPSLILIILYYLSLACLIVFKTISFRWSQVLKILSLSGFMLVSFLFFIPNKSKEFKLTSLFIGKNEAYHLQLPNNSSWLINTGRSSRWTIEPYLKSQGVNHLSGIFLASDYKKHRGGLESLLRNFSVDYVFSPSYLKHSKSLSWIRANKGFLEKDERVVLGKDSAIQILEGSKKRAIYFLNYQNKHILMLSQLNREALSKLSNYKELVLDTDILLLPSTNHFEEALFEKLAEYVDPLVVSLPIEPEGLARYLSERDIQLIDLKTYGATTFVVDGGGQLSVSTFLRGDGIYGA